MNSVKTGKPDEKKKLVINPFKTKPKLPDSYEEKTWCLLQVY